MRWFFAQVAEAVLRVEVTVASVELAFFDLRILFISFENPEIGWTLFHHLGWTTFVVQTEEITKTEL